MGEPTVRKIVLASRPKRPPTPENPPGGGADAGDAARWPPRCGCSICHWTPICAAAVQQVVIFGVSELIEGALILLPHLFRIAQVLEAVSVEIHRGVEVFFGFARMVLQQELCHRRDPCLTTKLLQ